MGLFSEKKRLRFILAVSLIFATMGIFTFMAVEPLRDVDFLDDSQVSGGFFTLIDYTLDCLAASVTIMNKGREYSFSALLNGHKYVYVLMPFENTGAVLTQSLLKEIESVHYLNTKNTILLKLRI